MPTFEYKSGLNRIEYDGGNELILTKQNAGLTAYNFDKFKEELNGNMHYKNLYIHGVKGISFIYKLKVLWKVWKFMRKVKK